MTTLHSEVLEDCLFVSIVHAQSCPTLCNTMDCSPLGSSVHKILQARILERIAIPFSRGSSRPRDQIHISCISCITELWREDVFLGFAVSSSHLHVFRHVWNEFFWSYPLPLLSIHILWFVQNRRTWVFTSKGNVDFSILSKVLHF